MAVSAGLEPPPTVPLAVIIASAILSSGTARHVCEANPYSLALAAAILERTRAAAATEHYTLVPYREGSASTIWETVHHPLNVLHTQFSRTLRGRLHDQLGMCNTLVLNANGVVHNANREASNAGSVLAGLRTSALQDLPLLMSHAAPKALLVLHGTRCTPSGATALYRGPFWIGNLTVPCWQSTFDRLVSTGTLVNSVCRSLGNVSVRILDQRESSSCDSTGDGCSAGGGAGMVEYLLCYGTFREHASECAKEQPLLERWASVPERLSGSMGTKIPAAPSCLVRKVSIKVRAVSRTWAKSASVARESLPHLLRRHSRYFAVFSCGGEQICLLYKSEVDEAYVAGLRSADGVWFPGDPSLVMPRIAIRNSLYASLASLLSRNVSDINASDPHHRLNGEAPCRATNRSRSKPCNFDVFGAGFADSLASMTHNLALAYHNGEWWAVGGRHSLLIDDFTRTSPLMREEKKADLRWWLPSVALVREQVRQRGRKAEPWLLSAAPNYGLGLAANTIRNTRQDRTLTGAGTFMGVSHSSPRSAHVKKSLADAQQLHAFMLRAIGKNHLRKMANLPAAVRAPRRGLWMMRGSAWCYPPSSIDTGAGTQEWVSKDGTVDEPADSPWHSKRLIINGSHPGCMERRDPKSSPHLAHLIGGGVCEYDGRLSLVHFNGSLLLFTRANPMSHGSRHVQMTRSVDDGNSWSPFQQIQIDGHDDAGDIYFFGVQVNPSHNGSLVAVFPLVHRLRACICISASADGLRWTRVTPLLSCELFGERTIDQPAAPSMVRRGTEVWLYVQEEVPGITIDRTTPKMVWNQMVKHEKTSRVVRYAFSCDSLASWTRTALLNSSTAKEAGRIFGASCGLQSDAGQFSELRASWTDSSSCAWSPRGPGRRRGALASTDNDD